MAEAGRPLSVRRLGVVPYREGLDIQAELVAARRAGAIPDTLLLLEHPHVITLGSSADPAHILAGDSRRAELGIEVFETGRGGDVTYHGPGQLVGYPILDLNPDRRDLHRYLRDLEEALMRAVLPWGLVTHRSPGQTGVWSTGGKLAAIGVRVSSGWITSHGFALNVRTDLSYFGAIVPCGIRDRNVTSIERELQAPVVMDEVVDSVVESFASVFERVVGVV